MSQENLRAVGDQIEGLLQELQASSDPRVGAQAREVVRLLMELYGAGLNRVCEVVADSTGGGLPLVDLLAADPLVGSLLLLHGLHPEDIEARVERALASVRPYLGSHGGDAKLVSVQGDLVRLRLEGTCQGCGSSTVTMKLAVETAIHEAAPEILRVEVEGMAEPAPGGPLIQIQGLKKSPPTPRAEGWVALENAPPLVSGGLAGIELAGAHLVLCRLGDDLFAYKDACPSCGTRLDHAALAHDLLACPSCSRRYDVRLAGHCVDSSDLHLEPLPLLRESGRVKIAVPAVLEQ